MLQTKAMVILVLSDLHIDCHDNFSIFGWNEQDFIERIEYLRDKHNIDKVIFNGDVFELLKYRFDEVRAANPLLFRYFEANKDFIFIKGNHDFVLDFTVDNYRITNSKGQIIHIEHGHNADWLNGKRIGRALGKFGFSILKRMSASSMMMNLYFRIVAYDDQINHIPKRYNTLRYLTYALKLLKDSDVVIMGHTHKLEAHHTYYLNRKKRYLNSGVCSMGRLQGIIMDTETLQYEFLNETSEWLKMSSEIIAMAI